MNYYENNDSSRIMFITHNYYNNFYAFYYHTIGNYIFILYFIYTEHGFESKLNFYWFILVMSSVDHYDYINGNNMCLPIISFFNKCR